MNKQKGFTIIELIVVIAIIAILAAIVLVNVTVYINKAKDARINSDIGNIAMGMAGCYSATIPASYSGCMTNTTYVPAVLLTDITSNSGSLTYTAAPSTAYCASSQLASSSSQYVCTDSTGVTTTGALKCTSATTSCQ